MNERTWVDEHGIEIFGREWTVDDPGGVVLVAHGASEHSGRYDRFARALNAAGFSVYALDHRGHGRTTTSTGPGIMGPPGGQALVDDLHELRAHAARRGVPTLLFGHSMGALIALAYLVQHAEGLAGAVLCGFPADPEGAAAMSEALQGAIDSGQRDAPARDLFTTNNAPFEPARTPFDWLSRDPNEVDRYIADPMCGDSHPLTYGYLVELLGLVAPARDLLGTIACPVFVIAGDQDTAAGMGAHAAALADAMKAAHVDANCKLYPGARHEILNETNRDEVTADVVAWLTDRAGSSSAVASP